MLIKNLAYLTISSSLFIIASPANGTNLGLGQIEFTSNNSALPVSFGTFEFDKDSSFNVDEEVVFEVTNLQITTPLGSNYTLNNLIDLGSGDAELPVFVPSTNSILGLNFYFEEGDLQPGNLFVIYFFNPDIQEAIFTEGFNLDSSSYSEAFLFDVGDRGTYIAREVPEPLTILGVGTAIAFGTTFKRKLKKSKSTSV